jgi:hypothetical protein
MGRNFLQLPRNSTVTTDSLYNLEARPTCYAEALSPLVSGFVKKMKKIQKWDEHGHCQVEDVEVEVPIKIPVGEGTSRPDISRGMESQVVRSGFHRLVYQKARYVREEHGNTYNCFQQAARDMVHSVHVCMKVTDVGRDLRKAVTKPDDEARHSDGNTTPDDEALHIDVNNAGEARHGNGDDDKCLHYGSLAEPVFEETAGKRRSADEDWKTLMDDLNLTPKIPSSKRDTKRSRHHHHRKICAVKSTPSQLENMNEDRTTLVA